MKISTKGRYALRLMMDLAENNSGSPISLKDVAKRQDISDKYLEQITPYRNANIMQLLAYLFRAALIPYVRSKIGIRCLLYTSHCPPSNMPKSLHAATKSA